MAADAGLAQTPVRETSAVAAAWVAAVVAVAVLGGLATDTASDWYQELDRPSWQPPGAVFGPVWTLLYGLIALSATRATLALEGARRRLVVALFSANLALNLGWTVIFFQAQAPELAGVEIIVLLLTILALGRLTWPHDRIAALALVPYAGWVAFASVLTWSIAAAN